MAYKKGLEVVFARNGRLERFPSASIKRFLLESPGGVYTTMRCSADRMVFDFPSHVARIHSGIIAQSPRLSFVSVQDIQASMQTNMRLVADQIPGDSRLIVLAQGDSGESLQFVCCGEPLPLKASGRVVSAVIRRFLRENPRVKSTQFVKDRQGLIDAQGGCEETLMVTGDEVMEGCSSNFFALMRKEIRVNGGDGKRGNPGKTKILATAKEGVLLGTMRGLAIDVAKRLEAWKEVEVVERPPRLSEVEQWEACFITSTSRIVMPISQLLIPKPGVDNSILALPEDRENFDVVKFDKSELLSSLMEEAEAGVRERSTKI